MKLDDRGVLTVCGACGTTNRLGFAGLDKATQCGKCKTLLPRPSVPIDTANTAVFDAAVASSSVPILVDFWAAWCGPCHMVAPEIKKVAQNMAGRVLVLKVDTDANPELGARYGIRSIPTIMVFSGGREVNRMSGVRPAAAIEQMVGVAA